jgi:ATP-binding cassette, subfamily F, member 3
LSFLVKATDISLAYGGQRVFDRAAFTLHPGDKVAVVGPNGAGKTTLFKILMGELPIEHPEGIAFEGDLKIGYMPQIHTIPGELTGLDVLRVPSTEERRLQRELDALARWMERPDAWDDTDANEKMARYSELQERLAEEQSKAQGTTSPLLAELAIQPESLQSRFMDLSGGEKTKLLLARALANARELDLIILDEPTNHLDVETVQWVEDFLLDLKGTILLAAHDRWLLDNVATRVFEVGGTKVESYDGNYSAYLEQKEAIARAWEAKRRRDHDELKRQIRIIEELKRRNRFDAQVRSRKHRLHIGTSRSATQTGPQAPVQAREQKVIRLEFKAGEKHTNDVMTVAGLKKSYGDTLIFEDVELEVRRGDKIALLGPNGCGKTTLLSILAGHEKPDAGIIEVSPGTKIGYFAQEHETLDPEATVLDAMVLSRGSDNRVPEAEARSVLGRFLFRGDDVHKKCSALSGGERARLALSQFILAECNLLILDEPTNHLDLVSQDVVQQALKQYPGTIIVVSHDRSFLDAVCTKVALVSGRRIGVFAGHFTDAWTTARMIEFARLDTKATYKVAKSFTDWETERRFLPGDRIKTTGMETQAFRRLLARAIELGWVEPLEETLEKERGI